MTAQQEERSSHPACLSDEDLLRECDVRRTRRSGPGGQHRNKVETAVVLTHRPTGVRAEANERRSQAQNHRAALRRLRVSLAVAHRSDVALQQPSRLWASRCHAGRIRISTDHEEFPCLLSEALDFLSASDWNVQAAAVRLGCTSSQLVRLLSREPRAIAVVNDERETRGLRRLR